MRNNQNTQDSNPFKQEKIDIDMKEALTAGTNFFAAQPTKICGECSKEYMKHPLVGNVRNREGKPYLTKICSGRFVRLSGE